MPKLSCPCGYIHDLSPIPDNGWRTIRDHDFESVIADEIQLAEISDFDDKDYKQRGKLIQNINGASGLLYLCPKCGRIMWRWENSEKFVVYVAEVPEEQ